MDKYTKRDIEWIFGVNYEWYEKKQRERNNLSSEEEAPFSEDALDRLTVTKDWINQQTQKQRKERHNTGDSTQWYPTEAECEVAYRSQILNEVLFPGEQRDDSEGESWDGQMNRKSFDEWWTGQK